MFRGHHLLVLALLLRLSQHKPMASFLLTILAIFAILITLEVMVLDEAQVVVLVPDVVLDEVPVVVEEVLFVKTAFLPPLEQMRSK
jgi:hypothetical protein